MRAISLLWARWSEIKKVNHKQKRMLEKQRWEFQFNIARCAESKEFQVPKPPGVQKHVSSWLKPPTDFIKLNVDAVFLDELKEGGWGLIARDADGNILCAAAGRLTAQSGADQAVATALLQAI